MVGFLHQDMVGGGPFNLECGEWADDTPMELCLAESLIEMNSFDDEAARRLAGCRVRFRAS